MPAKRRLVIAGVLLTGFVIGLFTHVDFFPGLNTYGVSVGTNFHYCSAELVHWRAGFSCEHAQ